MGFGFPVIFEELPAVKLRGELVPDIDFNELAKPIVQYICTTQELPFSGNQVKFIRMHLDMSLREFADFMGVKHQSVMRWEEYEKQPAHIEAHIEIFMRIKVLKALNSNQKSMEMVVQQVEEVNKLKASTYKNFKPLKIPDYIVHGHF